MNPTISPPPSNLEEAASRAWSCLYLIIDCYEISEQVEAWIETAMDLLEAGWEAA